jgi:hypothetical protein
LEEWKAGFALQHRDDTSLNRIGGKRARSSRPPAPKSTSALVRTAQSFGLIFHSSKLLIFPDSSSVIPHPPINDPRPRTKTRHRSLIAERAYITGSCV